MTQPSSTGLRAYRSAWFTVALLAAIIAIELAFPAWSRAQLVAVGLTGAIFGGILAWQAWRTRSSVTEAA
jgi:hypothetical protein